MSTSRPSIDEVMMEIAYTLAGRATCPKLAVGCVLTNGRGEIIGTGYNGVPRGFRHCTECDCGGANSPPGSDLCIAVHAEQNALQQCKDIWSIHTLYVTHTPCLRCTKDLLNTSCSRILCNNKEGDISRQLALWERSGREWYLRGERLC